MFSIICGRAHRTTNSKRVICNRRLCPPFNTGGHIDYPQYAATDRSEKTGTTNQPSSFLGIKWCWRGTVRCPRCPANGCQKRPSGTDKVPVLEHRSHWMATSHLPRSFPPLATATKLQRLPFLVHGPDGTGPPGVVAISHNGRWSARASPRSKNSGFAARHLGDTPPR